MASEVMLYLMINLHLYYINIQLNFYQNQVINECDRKNVAKIPVGCKEFFVTWRRTYVVNKRFTTCDYLADFKYNLIGMTNLWPQTNKLYSLKCTFKDRLQNVAKRN